MSVRLKITLACLCFMLVSAGMGGFAARMQTELGSLSVDIYDRAYLGMNFIARAQTGFLHFRAASNGADHASAATRLAPVLDDLDVAVDRAMSDRTRLLAIALHGRLAGVTGASDAATLAGIETDLARAVQRYGVDGLHARDRAAAIVAATQFALRQAILLALGIALLVGIALDRAVIPSLRRGVGIARAVAAGRLDNEIVAKGRSETAQLLRALAAMQAAILRSMAEKQALHAAEARQQQLHQVALTDSLDRLRELSDSTFEGLLIHRDGAILDANSAFCAMVGLPLELAKGRQVASFMALSDRGGTGPPAPSTPDMREASLTTSLGEAVPVEVRSREISYAGGPALVTALRDVAERQAAEKQIRFLAHHDLLTGLANRPLLHDILMRELATSQRQCSPIVVMCIDLDRFKAVNDTFGHQTGDLLLAQVADRIRENIRLTDTAARTGGDEFIVLHTSPGACGGAQLGRRLIGRLSEPYDIGGQLVSIGASIGIAMHPRDGAQVDVLLNNADLALYCAKSRGRGDFCFFEAEMATLQRERRELERDLAQAIDEEGLEVAFQPLFNVDTEEVTGFEALARWPHAARGNIAPAVFIPLAEETGLIVRLGNWVLETGCRAALDWPKPIRIAVNVSARQFKGGDLPAIVAGVLARTGLAADRLELEVTESVLIDESGQALAALTALKRLGVRIVLDDFGTGYSSLSYLRRFAFDKIKIDQSFIRNLTADPGAQAIVNAIIGLSRELDLQVTAEGVETGDQLALLRAARCGEVQGFLLGQPMGSRDVQSFLEGKVRPRVSTTEFA